jgi:hypothetical protein
VVGITTNILEKQVEEALLGLDPFMLVSIDTGIERLKYRTAEPLPLSVIIQAIEQFGPVVILPMDQEVPVDQQTP